MRDSSIAKDLQIVNRKKDHLRICLNETVQGAPCSLDAYTLPYRAIPEINLPDVSLEASLFPHLPPLRAPLMVTSMTGGEHHGRRINQNLAVACETEGIALGLGSMRIVDRIPSALRTFDVRKYCPSIPLLANIGLVQLNYGFTVEKVAELVSRVSADALCVHVNALQEAVQPEGETNFSGLLPKLRQLVANLRVPVVVKEVGHGFDRVSATRVRECGVRLLDVSGTGGTSWAWVESRRVQRPMASSGSSSSVLSAVSTSTPTLGELLRDRGLSLADSLQECSGIDGLDLMASGGIRNGMHMAKSLALGAKCCGAALPFLKPAMESSEAVCELVREWKRQLRVVMMSCGVATVQEMRHVQAKRRAPL